jgi:hypothetical protein
LYAINLDVVSLFVDSPFTFLAMFVSDVLYRFEWMNRFIFVKKIYAERCIFTNINENKNISKTDKQIMQMPLERGKDPLHL